MSKQTTNRHFDESILDADGRDWNGARWADISRSMFGQSEQSGQNAQTLKELESMLVERPDRPAQPEKQDQRRIITEDPGARVEWNEPKKLEKNSITDTPGILRGNYVPGSDLLIATPEDKEASKRYQDGTDRHVSLDDLEKREREDSARQAKSNQGLFQELKDAFKLPEEHKHINAGSLLGAARERQSSGREARNHDVWGEDFFDVLQKNHGKMDENQDRKLTLNELQDFVKRSDVDVHAREVGAFLINRFDRIKTMHEGHMPYFWGKGNYTRPRFSMFERDSNYLSPEDLTVLHHGITGDPLSDSGWKDRNNEKAFQGSLELGAATILGSTALYGYVLGAAATFPWGLIAGAGALAIHGLWTGGLPSQGESPKAAVEQLKSELKINNLHKEVQSWNYFDIKRPGERNGTIKLY